MIALMTFIENYLIELILFIGCLLSFPLARHIVQYDNYDSDKKRSADRRAIQLIFIIMFGALIVFSLLIS